VIAAADARADDGEQRRTGRPRARSRDRGQPPALLVWGKNDKIFPADGAHPYRRDLPDAELHLLDTGHFASRTRPTRWSPLIRDFLERKVAPH